MINTLRPLIWAAFLVCVTFAPAVVTQAQSAPAQAKPTPKPGGGLGDGLISQKVRHALILDRRLKPWGVGVASSSGIVVLKGTVQTAQAQVFAQQDAQKVSGVKRVVNRLKIAP